MKIRLSYACLWCMSLGFSAASIAEPARQADKVMAAAPVSVAALLQVILGLVLILALILGGAMLLRRLGYWQMSHGGALKLVAGLSLGPREKVVVIQVGTQQLLLGITPGRIVHIMELNESLPEVSSGIATVKFKDRLAQILQGKPDREK